MKSGRMCCPNSSSDCFQRCGRANPCLDNPIRRPLMCRQPVASTGVPHRCQSTLSTPSESGLEKSELVLPEGLTARMSAIVMAVRIDRIVRPACSSHPVFSLPVGSGWRCLVRYSVFSFRFTCVESTAEEARLPPKKSAALPPASFLCAYPSCDFCFAPPLRSQNESSPTLLP